MCAEGVIQSWGVWDWRPARPAGFSSAQLGLCQPLLAPHCLASLPLASTTQADLDPAKSNRGCLVGCGCACPAGCVASLSALGRGQCLWVTGSPAGTSRRKGGPCAFLEGLHIAARTRSWSTVRREQSPLPSKQIGEASCPPLQRPGWGCWEILSKVDLPANRCESCLRGKFPPRGRCPPALPGEPGRVPSAAAGLGSCPLVPDMQQGGLDGVLGSLPGHCLGSPLPLGSAGGLVRALQPHCCSGTAVQRAGEGSCRRVFVGPAPRPLGPGSGRGAEHPSHRLNLAQRFKRCPR